MDFRQPYLSTQLIAYIGNKRALLPFLHEVFAGLVPDPSRTRFLDPFAGSGSVSRLARAMGFQVSANDWEPYAEVINLCHLGVDAGQLESLFAGRGGLDAVLRDVDSCRAPVPGREYIGRHYAPAETAAADWRTERLFYTRENALALDGMRERIEELFPGPGAGPAKAALLAPILYEAATHTNTSGVFKACHRGFGGHGRDALSRIMAPVHARPPVLWPGKGAEVCRLDAREFLAGRPAEICYLDPPYATHQYGSNYFMLNTLALWDRPPVSSERAADGRLEHKAGIRPDWVRTRSPFCNARTAAAALRDTLDAVDARWIVVSYSDEGLIPLEELCDLLAAQGALSVRSTGHVKYPGGRQSATRTVRTSELAFVVERGAPGAAASARALVAGARVQRLLAGSFHPGRIRERFPVQGDAIVAGGAVLPMDRFWRFVPGARAPAAADGLAADLAACAVRDVAEELEVVTGLAAAEGPGAARERLHREALRLLNKLAHPRYRAQFDCWRARLRGGAAEGSRLARGLDALEERAARRLAAALPRKREGLGRS